MHTYRLLLRSVILSHQFWQADECSSSRDFMHEASHEPTLILCRQHGMRKRKFWKPSKQRSRQRKPEHKKWQRLVRALLLP
jgi:hypothetical protein